MHSTNNICTRSKSCKSVFGQPRKSSELVVESHEDVFRAYLNHMQDSPCSKLDGTNIIITRLQVEIFDV